MARYEYTEGFTPAGELRGAHEFWEIELAGRRILLRFGRLGARGRSHVKVYDTDDAARKAAIQMVRRKERKGYRYVEGSPPPPRAKYEPPPRAANAELLTHIHDRPTDPDAYLVYADFLQAAGDPLGELMALGHAMHGESNATRFLQLQRRRDELLAIYDRHFFGPLTELRHEVKLDWRLGLVYRASLTRAAPGGLAGPYDDALVQATLSAPVCMALQELHFEDPAANVLRVLSLVQRLAPPSLRTLVVAGEHELPTDLPTTAETAALFVGGRAEAMGYDLTDIVTALGIHRLSIGAGLSVGPVPSLRALSVVLPFLPTTGAWPNLRRLRVRWMSTPIDLRALLTECACRMPALEDLELVTRYEPGAEGLFDAPLLNRLRRLSLKGAMSESTAKRLLATRKARGLAQRVEIHEGAP